MKFYPDLIDKVNNILWYSLKRVFSFFVKFIYIIGGRGYGKTYSIKTFFIKDFLKNGHKFAWFRTTETALDRIRDPLQFFGRLKNLPELGVTSYDIKKDVIYINKKVAGYLFPVATFHNIKGADYDCVNGAWDEFMRASGERPVPNKRAKFFDAVESVFRTEGARVFLISNSTNQFDEMLEPFKITLKEYGCYVYREDNAVIHYVQPSEKHNKHIENSLAFTGMSEQDKKMAYSNKFTSYGDFGKETKMKYLYSLQVSDDKFLNLYTNEDKIYIKSGLIDGAILYTTITEFVNSKVRKLNPTSKKLILNSYNNGRIIFFDGYCRTMFQDSIA